MRAFTEAEAELGDKLVALKAESGSHSPSLLTLREELPDLEINVDACFISNPYATQLFLDYFKTELLDTGAIRDVLEFYPSQNQVIAALLAGHLGIDAERVFVGNGAIEIIQAVVHTFAKRKVLVTLPTFSSYYEFAEGRVDVAFHTLRKEEDFRLDPAEYLEVVKREKPDLITLINPNNPDGSYIPYEDLLSILRDLPAEVTAVVDESFIHFAFEDLNLDIRSVISHCEEFPNLIVVKSMSKDFGVAGIRAGYAVMHPDRVAGLLQNGFLWNSNGLAEYFFRLYTRKDFLAQYDIVRKQYILETQLFYRQLEKVKGLHVYPSMANFALVELVDGSTADELMQHLLVRHGVYVRTCSDKIGLDGEFLRIASRGLRENQQIIEALTDVLGPTAG
ncbi:MAG: histidinol-phosphate aminotransferase family protein [Actinobacteria bacterium]|nr:histidinol-phosphate aminotransferase family protein [Actinomycetota bacterium]